MNLAQVAQNEFSTRRSKQIKQKILQMNGVQDVLKMNIYIAQDNQNR